MTLRLRQRTGIADTSCVALLCMTTTMLLGFSTPPTLPAEGATSFTVQPRPVAALAESHHPVELPSIAQMRIPVRPSSFATQRWIQPTLATINSRTWATPTLGTNDPISGTSARKSDTRSSPSIGQFHGVGFPDIRTYSRAKRSPFDPPGPWAPLVTWRTLQGEDDRTQPIARVRCMGLSPKAVARRADRYLDTIYQYADRYDISPQLVKAVITVESCFNNKAVSPVGAQGLMQLMPDTASWLKVKDVNNPEQNLRGGIRYLASLQKQFDTLELVLAAYNAGPGNVRRYNGVPPFAETRAYVTKVQANFRRYQAAHDLLHPIEESIEQAFAVTSR